ncbi:ribosome biogenesis factor YjgA [Facilibium subflavum]|uniref:ribosome biogenesis factor YjgA n=1 Tax=Facilibium subflavum TaxID=2219058 RepID=UPI000E6474D3|nr:ribosome biogenesis factor YjgA [Facilibium subflavum]
MTNSPFDANGDDTILSTEKSKTQIKKESLDITAFGRKLLQLNVEQLKKLPLDSSIIDELIKAKSMSKIALKRQTQYIGKLLRKTHIDDAVDFLEKQNKSHSADVARSHRLEKLRDKLVDPATSQKAITELMQIDPTVDVQRLRQLVRAHQKEVSQQKPLKSYRQIFQLLKEIKS